MDYSNTENEFYCFLKVGRTDEILNNFNNNQITFGCPANWLDYARKEKNPSVGDILESVYACCPISEKELHINQEQREYTIIGNASADSCYLYKQSTILTPALCFMSFKNEDEYKNKCFFNINEYIGRMQYLLEEASILIIKDVKTFHNELNEQVPTALSNSKNVIFKKPYDYTPVRMQHVDYDFYEKYPFFDISNNTNDEMFYKRKRYSYQSEVRIILNGTNYTQKYNTNDYDFKKNQLAVSLPNLKKYARVVSATEINGFIVNFKDDGLYLQQY